MQRPCSPASRITSSQLLTKCSGWLDDWLQMVFPEACVACGALPTDGAGFCGGCRCSLSATDRPVGIRFPGIGGPRLLIWSSYLYVGQLVPAIHHFKYHRQLAAGRALARLMLERIPPWLEEGAIDALVAVPSRTSRLATRGYNPAAQIAGHLARALGIPMLGRCVRSQRWGRRQTGHGHAARKDAADPARWPACRRVDRLRLLLIDDVVTTGATLSGVTRALLSAGAQSVAAWTLAATPS